MRFVLLCNLDAIARDGRLSLWELKQTRTVRDLEGDVQYKDPIDLYEVLMQMDTIFEEATTTLEDLGLDSNRAILSLIDDSTETIRSLHQIAVKQNFQHSDKYCSTLQSLLDRGIKLEDLDTEIMDHVEAYLSAENPTEAQIGLVQTYYKHLIIDTVSCKDEAFKQILDAVKKVKGLKTTNLTASIL